MKILYLGDLSYGQTCAMRMRAFQRLGHEVVGVDTIRPWKEASWGARRVGRLRAAGQIVDRINASVIEAAREFGPDMVWADKQEFLGIDTLVQVRSLGATMVHFTPDPYFTLSWKRTKIMDQALPFFDVLVYCKTYERRAYEQTGRLSIYMPLGYCDEIHRPLPSSDPSHLCDVGFVGGWEPERETLLRAVLDTGVDLKLRGGYWDFLADGKWTLRRHAVLRQLAGADRFTFHKDEALARRWIGGEVYGDEYAKVLSGAKIGLGFLRRVCPDQHTTRTFEIPACGSMLLARRTDEHCAFFAEDEEAVFFDTQAELVDKVRFYTSNPAVRDKIAARGHEKCVRGGYSYIQRLSAVVAELDYALGSKVAS